MRDSDLDDLLDMAARARPEPSAALIERVLADALAEQPQNQAQPRPKPKAGWLARLASAFGGGPALAGVCSSVVLGLAVGYLNPATLDYLTSGVVAADTVELFPSTDFLATEG